MPKPEPKPRPDPHPDPVPTPAPVPVVETQGVPLMGGGFVLQGGGKPLMSKISL
jgi:hypothetical protein